MVLNFRVSGGYIWCTWARLTQTAATLEKSAALENQPGAEQ